jgi:hypothetical protein
MAEAVSEPFSNGYLYDLAISHHPKDVFENILTIDPDM